MFCIFFSLLSSIKISECNSVKCYCHEKTYSQIKKDVILNRVKDYYKTNKERLKKQARDKYRHLSKEDKNKKREYRRNRCHNKSEETKQKLEEYQKIYCAAKKLNKNTWLFFFSLYQKWNKKLCNVVKMVLLKAIFIKIRTLLIIMK